MPLGFEFLLIAVIVGCIVRLAPRDPERRAWVKAYWLSSVVAIVAFAAVVALLAMFAT